MGLVREKRMAHAEWMAYLDTPGRKLTLAEFCALEQMLAASSLESVTAALGTHPTLRGGYLEQIRNLLDRFARVLLRPRTPAGEPRALKEGGG